MAEVVSYASGTQIVEEGGSATAMFIIKSGQAVVSQQLVDGGSFSGAAGSDSPSRLCKILKAGDYFGERAPFLCV